MGRPTKCTSEKIDSICKYVRIGNFPEIAAKAAGIGRRTFYIWKQQGRIDAKEGRKSCYAHFLHEIKKAEAEAELNALARIVRAATNEKHWTAAAWLLERRYGQRWAKREALDIKADTRVRFGERTVGDRAALAADALELADAVSAGAQFDSGGRSSNGKNGSGPAPRR